ncbi:Hypothetical predicted protein [Pelobates cultripes]|uniref:Uncharacterized protein n=1 Tax=Pelobates cultripes TaxID=61616 RepID=A0AAD1VU29_PELCU|nr:Hypothetical predicted protein [Pelobates cultripes]
MPEVKVPLLAANLRVAPVPLSATVCGGEQLIERKKTRRLGVILGVDYGLEIGVLTFAMGLSPNVLQGRTIPVLPNVFPYARMIINPG